MRTQLFPTLLTLLRIRLLQLRRQAIDAGPLYSALALLVLCGLVATAWYQYRQPGRAPYVSAAILLLLLSLHYSRRDAGFVRRHLPHAALSMASEYGAVVLPLAAGSLTGSSFWHFPVLLLLCPLVALLPPLKARRIALPGLGRWIAPADFEWLSGFRRGRYFLPQLLLAAYATTPFRFVPLLPLWFLMVAVASFYADCESPAVLRATGDTAGGILRRKIRRHTALLLKLMLPPLLLNAVFQPRLWWISLCFLLLQWIVLLFSILLKYSSYRPGESLQGNAVISGLAVLSAALPFLVPLPLLLSLRYYPRALRNLKNFTGDPD